MVKETIDFDRELAKAHQQHEESLKIATQHGFVLDTTEWLTIKRYAEKYGVSQQVVVNWINRGIVPADCTMILHEFNDMRLIKDQAYK